MPNQLYNRYKVLSAKLGKDDKLIPYKKNEHLWKQLQTELDNLNINPDHFLEFTLNYMINLYSNNFFSRDRNQFKSISKYLANIKSGNEAIEGQSEELTQQYTSLYLLTSLCYNTLLLKDEDIEPKKYSNSLYDLMLAYSPIIIAYKILNKELNLDIVGVKDNTYYDFIKQGYFDKFFSYYEELREMPKEEILQIYKKAYRRLDNISDQIITIDNNVYLMGTIGTGDFNI